jgi:molybdenum cofactor biosynthesis enzyme MoaA
LLRRDLPSLIASLANKSWVRDLAMTTNGGARPTRRTICARACIASPSASIRSIAIGSGVPQG